MKKLFFVCLLMFVCGCATNFHTRFSFPVSEPQWIRMGEPIMFDSQMWYPTDNIENLLDSEMIFEGTYKDIQFFTERRDIKPFDYIYTKFASHKYRLYERKDD